VTQQLVQKHRYCLFASQPDHEKVYSKLEYVAQICREAMQKRGRDKGVWLWQEAMEPLLEHEGTTASLVLLPYILALHFNHILSSLPFFCIASGHL